MEHFVAKMENVLSFITLVIQRKELKIISFVLGEFYLIILSLEFSVYHF